MLICTCGVLIDPSITKRCPNCKAIVSLRSGKPPFTSIDPDNLLRGILLPHFTTVKELLPLRRVAKCFRDNLDDKVVSSKLIPSWSNHLRASLILRIPDLSRECWGTGLNGFIELSENMIAARSDYGVHVWQLGIPKIKLPLGTGPKQSSALTDVFHLRDSTFCSGHVNGDLRIWDLRDGLVPKTPGRHTSSVQCFARLSDDAFMSCEEDGEIKVWSAFQPFNLLHTLKRIGDPGFPICRIVKRMNPSHFIVSDAAPGGWFSPSYGSLVLDKSRSTYTCRDVASDPISLRALTSFYDAMNNVAAIVKRSVTPVARTGGRRDRSKVADTAPTIEVGRLSFLASGPAVKALSFVSLTSLGPMCITPEDLMSQNAKERFGLIKRKADPCQIHCTALATSLKHNLVAVGCRSGLVMLCNITTKKRIILEGHTDKVTCIKFLSNGSIASLSADKTIRIWANTLHELRQSFSDQHR